MNSQVNKHVFFSLMHIEQKSKWNGNLLEGDKKWLSKCITKIGSHT